MQNPEFCICANCGKTIFSVDIHTEEEPIIYGHLDKHGCSEPQPEPKLQEESQ